VPVSRAQFLALCEGAAIDAVRSFVAGLYEARGRTVERAGDHLVVSTGPRTHRVAVLSEATWAGSVPEGADRTVVAADLDTSEPGITDAVNLHRQLLYAVDRTEAAALLEAHFDRPLSSLEPPTGPGTGEDPPSAGEHDAETESQGGGTAPRSSDVFGSYAVVAVVLASCLLVAGITVAVGALAAGGPESATPAPSTSTGASGAPSESVEIATPSDGPAPISAAFPREDDPAPDIRAGSSRAFPPGIDSGGIADETELIDAHRSILANSSYRLTLTYRELVDGHATGVYTERIRVANGSRYAVSTTRTGEFRTVPRSIAGADQFANGSVLLQRTGNRVGEGSLGAGGGDLLDDVTRYLGWYLSVSNSSVGTPGRDGEGLFRITTRGDPYPGVRNATGTAFVTHRGLIRDIRRVHERPSADVRVVVRMRVTDVGETAVSRPPWVDGDRQNRTAASRRRRPAR